MIAVIIGFIIGGVLGLTGAGGSLFSVPLLLLFLNYNPSEAIGISLGIVSINAFFGVLLQGKSKNIQWIPALSFVLIGSLFAPIGVYFQSFFSTFWLMVGFNVLVIFVAYKLWVQSNKQKPGDIIIRGKSVKNEASVDTLCSINNDILKLPCILGIGGSSIVVGLLTGLFGVGGGFIIVPTLILLTGMSMHKAVATSLVIISVISGTGFIGYIYQGGNVYGNHLGLILLGGMIGIFMSKIISNRLNISTLQKIFAIVMVLISIGALFK